MTRWLIPLLLALSSAGCSSVTSREICGDGLDNDGNGQTDCDDRDCAGKPECAPPFYGTCPKCGQACTQQNTCVEAYAKDRPIPYCSNGVCQQLGTFIQPRIELNTKTNWGGLAVSPQSASTRFIKKKANDGSAVTCTRLATVAADRTVPDAIETNGALVVQGLDVTRVTNPMLGQGITLAFVNTQVGDDYLIWVELWGGAPNSTTSYPTGRRFGYGCFDAPALVTPLVAEDNCPSTTSDAGTCRKFVLEMPPPEQ